jgi:hypothetical protein
VEGLPAAGGRQDKPERAGIMGTLTPALSRPTGEGEGGDAVQHKIATGFGEAKREKLRRIVTVPASSAFEYFVVSFALFKFIVFSFFR